MIKAANLSKKIGSKTILRDIDLHIPKGQFVTVFGPNGAGKSTLLKTLAMLMKPSTGEIMINGFDARKDPVAISKQLGVISHQTFLYENLTARENLEFYGRMYDVPDLRDRLYKVLHQVGLEFSLNDPVRTFSRGMQQRLAIARAILHDPAVLFLDEPYTGLDPHAIQILNSVLARLNNANRTVFMITHNFEEGLDITDRVLFVVKGQIVYDGDNKALTRDDLKQLYLQKAGGGG
ncbi:ABC transporter ATP-binding protein [bacterium]|nr:MAG: ABC transporter ATP-binding protein [bacterium]